MGHGWEGEAQELGGPGGSGGVGRETQTEDQELSVISCSKYIDKLDGQTTMKCIENCARHSWKSVISWEGPWPLSEVFRPQRKRPLDLLWKLLKEKYSDSTGSSWALNLSKWGTSKSGYSGSWIACGLYVQVMRYPLPCIKHASTFFSASSIKVPSPPTA